MARIAHLLLAAFAAAAILAAVLAHGPERAPGPPAPVAAPPTAAEDVEPEKVPEPVFEEVTPVIAESKPSHRGEGEVPPGNRGTGSASLELSLVDRATGRPVDAQIRLWRLDVPEDHEWTAGDHVQAHADVKETGAGIQNLPEGRYRIQCDAQRKGAEDPPEFLVAGRTERSLPVDMPRKFQARLAVYDDRGEPIELGLLVSGIQSSCLSGPRVPGWASPRRLKDGTRHRRFVSGAG